MEINIFKTDSFFLSGILFTLLSCSQPLFIGQTDTIIVNMPDYDTSYLPLLLSYRIEITSKYETKTFSVNPDTKQLTITVPKDYLTSILVYPVTKPLFFQPAGCIYPYDFYNSNLMQTGSASWSSGKACILLSELLSSNIKKNINSALNFNWGKLEETLKSKDINSFNNFDSLKTKKCTTAGNLNIEILKTKIINNDLRISVSYYDTKLLTRDKIKSAEISEDSKLYFEYIPLNQFYKEKGWITFQNNSESKTAFLLDGKIIYISN